MSAKRPVTRNTPIPLGIAQFIAHDSRNSREILRNICAIHVAKWQATAATMSARIEKVLLDIFREICV